MPQPRQASRAKTRTVADAVKELAPGSLKEALLAFQADPPVVRKDAKVESTKSQKTGKMSPKYDYTTLQELRDKMRPRLTELGLLWQTKAGVDAEGKACILYSCTHVGSGESDDGVMPLVAAGSTMQGLGSSMSFGRRYAEIIYFGLAPDVDEDAAGPTAEAQARKTKGTQADKKITVGRAEQLLGEFKAINALNRVQVAASQFAGQDVGEANTKPKAIAALRKLTGSQADDLEVWLKEKREQALAAQPELSDGAEPDEDARGDEGDAA